MRLVFDKEMNAENITPMSYEEAGQAEQYIGFVHGKEN